MSRAFKFVLNRNKKLKNGYAITLYTNFDKVGRISTGMSSKIVQWDARNESVRPNHPNERIVNKKLSKIRQKAEDVVDEMIDDMDDNDLDFSFEDFKARFSGESNSEVSDKVLDFLDYYVNMLTERDKIGTRDKYRQLKIILMASTLFEDIKFKKVKRPLLEKLETFLEKRKVNGRKISPNTINFYFRHLRTLYNRAIQHGVTKQTDFPFKNMMNVNGYSFSGFKAPKVVRCLSIEELEGIKNYNGPFNKSRDLFLFLYYSYGMYIGDASMLSTKNVVNKTIQYSRGKTLGLIPPIIIDEKLNGLLRSFENDGYYLLGVLNKATHQTTQAKKNRIHKIKRRINIELRAIAKELGIDKPVTTRVARHTFANVMRKKGYTVYQIMSYLGHQDVKVTQVYLDSIDSGEYVGVGGDL